MPRTVKSLTRLLLLAALGAACGTPESAPAAGTPTLVERTHMTMGSELAIAAWTGDEAAAVAAFDAAFAEADRLDRIMSVWQPGSELLQINAAAGGHPVPASADVREVMKTAIQVGDWTGGKFDVTFGALSGLWKFDAQNQDNSIPTSADIERRLPLIDYTTVRVDDAAGTVFLSRAGVSAHLGGIGKGYAVDRVAGMLRQAGLRDFMVQFGGDMFLSGRRGDRPWRVALRDPRGPLDQAFAAIELSDETFSTSGDYERFFMAGGRRYHHIIDPDTGAPARGARSVTIIARTSTLADALSTGVFVMGPDEGMALVERLSDVEAVIVTDDNEVRVSAGLRNRLVMLREPTNAP
jgi:thiamine biosynthesis lipoprotein